MKITMLVLAAIAAVSAGQAWQEITVDGFTLRWATVEGNNLAVQLNGPTTGWVAVGFEPTAAMKDADIIIGYVEDGTLFLRDDFGDGHISHSPDTELGGTDDVTGISGTEEGQITSISFSIPLDSGDGYDRQLTPGSTVKVILAYGPDGADDFEGYHAWAETVEVEL